MIETLEKTCEEKIFRLLRPLVEDMPLVEKFRYVTSKLTLEELLNHMSRSSDLGEQMVAATLLRQLQFPHWRNHLRSKMIGNTPLFNRFAYELLEA